MDEYLDLINEKDEVIGTVVLSEAHKNKYFAHRGVATLIYYDSKILFCQRSLKKESNPGIWTVASSGHVKAGQSPVRAAIEEAQEEIGLSVNPVFLYKHWERLENETMCFHVFIAKAEDQKVVVDKEEIEAYNWVGIDEIVRFMKDNKVDSVSKEAIMNAIKYVKENK